MMRSNKLNSAVDMLYDQLKSKIDFYWERLHNEFIELDKTGSGTIDKENFKVRFNSRNRCTIIEESRMMRL